MGTFDNTDKKLISILYEDGRASLSSMGKELGMSHVAVSKRLNKLRKKNLLRVTAGINVDRLQANVIFLALETESIDVADRLVEKYRHCPRLLMLSTVTGRYNLFAVLVAEDTDSLESMLGTCSMRVEEGVRRSETWFGNAPVVPQYLTMDLAPSRTDGAKSACGCVCDECKRYQIGKCVGCPESSMYRGSLWASKEEPKKSKRRKS